MSYSRRMPEHLTLSQARHAVVVWHDLLCPGGQLQVIVPDLVFHARQLLKLEKNWTNDPNHNLAHAMAGLYGWHNAGRGSDEIDAHRWGYTYDSLVDLLTATDFVQVKKVNAGPDVQVWT